MNHDFVREIASHFALDDTPDSIAELTAGNINSSFLLTMGTAPDAPVYVLQRINTNVFKDPVAVMQNIGRVTVHIHDSYIAEGCNADRRVLHFVPADTGSLLYMDSENGAWRLYRHIGGSTAHNSIDSPALFYEAGRGFGDFQARLSNFPAEQLAETIPNFHNTPRRFETFLASVEADVAGRAAEVREEIEFLRGYRDLTSAITSRLGADLPLRVTHNDTKLNNVLIDDVTGKAICVIDLDTVMPGSSLYDYGDAIRFGACTAAEDEPDTDKIGFSMELFEAFTEGFVSATAGGLTPAEVKLLPTGALVMTLEAALRFLTDYLDGDTYFKTRYPGHNLVRTRAQIKLLREMEAHLDAMNAYVARLAQ